MIHQYGVWHYLKYSLGTHIYCWIFYKLDKGTWNNKIYPVFLDVHIRRNVNDPLRQRCVRRLLAGARFPNRGALAGKLSIRSQRKLRLISIFINHATIGFIMVA